jgi:hypothetical protein
MSNKLNKSAYNIFAGDDWPSYDEYVNDLITDDRLKKELAELENNSEKVNIGYEYQSVMSAHIDF